MGKSKTAAAKAAEIKEPVQVQAEAQEEATVGATAAGSEPEASKEATAPEAEAAPVVEAETAKQTEAATATDSKPAKQAETAEATAAPKPASKASARAAAAKKPAYPPFLAGYIKAYPGEKVFHVTSDKQVFLDKDYGFAKAHQSRLGGGKLETYNI